MPLNLREIFGAVKKATGTIIQKAAAPKSKRKSLWQRPQAPKLPKNLEGKFSHVYSPRSKVIKGKRGFVPAKVKGSKGKVVIGNQKVQAGDVGWIDTEYGGFISRSEIERMLDYADKTRVAEEGVSLGGMFRELPPEKQLKVAENLADYDWESFWDDIGSDDPQSSLTKAQSAYDELVELMGDAFYDEEETAKITKSIRA